MDDVHQLSAAELGRRYADGSLSPVEVTRALLARIAAWEPKINAMYRVRTEDALAQARAAEARWRSQASLSPIDGVPVTIKENVATAGDPAPIGTRANEELGAAAEDAPPAARLREAGCVILGKTTMPDFGMLSSGLSSLHGVTRNPWNRERNTSGSSSGAGAAAAAGYAPLHIGTDIGGSIRLPATHCGIFGLKPSLGRVPIYPPYTGRVAGPMTRSVRDFMSLPPEKTDYSARLEDLSPKGLRIGLLTDMRVGLPVHAEVRAAAEGAARALAAAGAEVEPMGSFLDAELFDGMLRFFEARSYAEYCALAAERQAKVLPFIVEWCWHRAKDFSGVDVMTAVNQVVALRDATVRATQPFDYVISPVSPILPYEAERACPGNDPHDALPHIAFTVPYNMSEQPAASINWTASADGLPIGVQIVGRRFDDHGVLRLARLIETLRPAQRAWPEL
jgi:aspartyl-tRNA(Asn)/glutamyl-tRNA(Gln) amidotransferase subunit A